MDDLKFSFVGWGRHNNLSSRVGDVVVYLKTVRYCIAAVVFCCFSVGNAYAATPEALAFPCMACHGPEGNSQGDIPSLNGRSFDYLKSNLLAFKQRQRRGVIMNRIARGYSDEQIEVLARYFSALK